MFGGDGHAGRATRGMGPCTLPVMPPAVTRHAAPSRSSGSAGPLSYEPKWDGFRSIIFRDGDEVELGSRNEQADDPLLPRARRGGHGRAARALRDRRRDRASPASGGLDFEALQQRIHPADVAGRHAGRADAGLVRRLRPARARRRRSAPAARSPSAARRWRRALAGAQPPIHLTPATTDASVAEQWFSEFEGAGLDGVVAKPLDGTYQPDKRVMFKIKHERTADCVVAGYRCTRAGRTPSGRCCSGCTTTTASWPPSASSARSRWPARRELFDELAAAGRRRSTSIRGLGAARRPAPAARARQTSRWNAGKDLSFVPLRPERVVEVRYEHMEGTRFRHTAQFVRWRAGPRAAVLHLRPAGGAGPVQSRGRAGRLTGRPAAQRRAALACCHAH